MPKGTFVAALALAAALVSASAVRADYYDGQRAWDSKRYAEALAEWRGAASEGDARSMRALGRMYVAGLGVPQDYIEAHKWLNLAAARGDAEAASERDALAAKMTPGQIASAQDRAREWRPDAAAAPEAAPAAPAARAEASSAPPGPPPPRAIREAQELLAALGYAPGPADGQWGARTGSAYAAFLRDAGLPPEGALTPEALRAMREIAAGGGEEPVAAAPPPAPALPRDALHRMARAGDIDGLTAALAAGADANGRDGKGWTALMHAADQGSILLVPPLLKAGADPNIRASDGATALFIATLHRHTAIIEALRNAGADPRIKGPKGMTSIDIARSHGPLFLLALRTTESFRDCDTCPEMIVVPSNRKSLKPFAVGKFEITRGQYEAFSRATNRKVDKYDNCHIWHVSEIGAQYQGYRSPAFPQEKNHPVVCVNWHDAQEYTEWISGKTGENYRLLKQAEWEYAAMFGRRIRGRVAIANTDDKNLKGLHHNEYACKYGNIADRYLKENAAKTANINIIDCDDGYAYTAPVGGFLPNQLGVHDMHGNVEEWTLDCDSRGCDRGDKGTCGKGWNSYDIFELKRDDRPPTWRTNSLGFRVARDIQ